MLLKIILLIVFVSVMIFVGVYSKKHSTDRKSVV